MKKAIRYFVTVLLVLCTGFAFTGCGSLPASEDNAALATTAPSSSVTQQFTHERQLYEEVLAEGYTGSFFEFLQEINVALSDDSAAINSAFTSAVCVECNTASGAKVSTSSGAGVIWRLDTRTGTAFIVTNYHVVYFQDPEGNYGLSKQISVYLYGATVTSRAVQAVFYGGDMDYDIAVLKVTDSGFRASESNTVYARATDICETVSAGERVYAIGNPDTNGFSVTGGVVSVPYETIQVLRADDKIYISLPEIRIDAAINHGNSGGGLFNAKGELVGIVNARSESEDFTGYAIPASVVKDIVSGILEG